MTPLDEARRNAMEHIGVLRPVSVGVADGLGLITAEAVEAVELSPPFDNSAMDGYAVRSADLGPDGAELSVVGEVAAGENPTLAVGPGEATKIMTGAVLPEGADAVVMVEHSREVGADRVAFDGPVEVGTAIRRAGEDLKPGDHVLAAGVQLGPAQLGILATVGRSEIQVVPRPRVGVFSTGDELVGLGQPLQRGQIRDSNRLTMLALVAGAGGEPVDLGWIPDEPDRVAACVREASESCDVVLTSGGVSMGDHDHVRYVLDDIGSAKWMQVAIRPAKPLVVARVGDTPVFGLPGNPVSVVVSFTLFVGPALRKLAGHTEVGPFSVSAVAASDLGRQPDGKTHFARVRFVGSDVASGAGGTGAGGPGSGGLEFRVEAAGGQGSHQLGVLSRSDALAVLPDGDGVAAGEPVEVLPLGPIDTRLTPW